ncbi:MAG: PBP1A family penicillin-binding protein [Proteobacteria bacterium]|nr:PBP1A family penicillin-binding protein [Pseudomonadota bacterium]
MSRRPKRPEGGIPKKSPLRRLFNALLGLIVLGLLGWSLLFIAFAPELPDTAKIWQQDRNPGTIVLAADGSELARRGGFAGRPVGYQEFPEHLLNAVIATEDRRFFGHFGIDVLGLARATWRNISARRIVEGGSTITQQLAKNLYLSPERTLNRKIQEMFLAVWLESRLTKKEILTIYLNRVYFGAGAYGVASAARLYFDKPVNKLDLAESAMMAGLLKAPSRLAPTVNPKGAAERAAVVLSNMVAAGYLEPAAADRARGQPAPVASAKAVGSGQYFVDWVLSRLPDDLRATDRDLVVTTTLEPTMQGEAESAIAKALKSAIRSRVGEAALVALGSDGRVRAMIGGRDYRANRYNRATQARRQPGSAFKPMVYTAALEASMHPDSPLDDSRITVEGWTPVNYNGHFNGRMAMSEALARSVNAAVVRLQEKIGRGKIVDVAHRMGIASKLNPVPSLALGSSEVGVLELTAAYLPFINQGAVVQPYGIVEVRTLDGTRLYLRSRPRAKRAINRQVADDMRRMLQGAVTNGTGRRAAIKGAEVGGKTGTSQEHRDAWFLGFAGDTVAGVWFGNDDGAPMKGVTGGGLPARTWQGFMARGIRSQAVAIRLPPPLEDATKADEGLGLLDRIADAVFDSVVGPPEKGGPDAETREHAKGILRWFVDQAASGRPPDDSDQPREDFGQ